MEVPNGHEIDDADSDAFLQEGRTLADKGIAMLRTILVCGADDLDGRNQSPAPLRIVNSDLVFVEIGHFRLDGEARCRRRPHGGCHSSVITRRAYASTLAVDCGNIVFFECSDVDLRLSAQVNTRSSDIGGRQLLV